MRIQLIFAAALALIVSACNAAGTNQSLPSAVSGANGVTASDAAQPAVDHTSVLKMLTSQLVVGTTVDPNNGDQKPAGLAYVKSKPFGKSVLKKGDLVVCNYNDSANVQGNGTTIEYMSSATGSSPTTLVQDASLKGCASLVINSYGEVFASASGAKDAVGVNPAGKITQTLKSTKLLVEPWGSAYVPSSTGYPPGDGLWIGDASKGTVVRINLGTGGKPTYTAVISGFPVNGGKPGSILGPSGMQYQSHGDTLYVVDGANNTVYSFKNAYNNFNSANSVVIGKDGKSFTGPQAKNAKVVYSGPPLNGPVSSTLLPNGNLVIGNTMNSSGKNWLVEIASDGKELAYKNVDKGAPGAIFGLVSTGTNDDTTKIYFSDVNANNVQVLQK